MIPIHSFFKKPMCVFVFCLASCGRESKDTSLKNPDPVPAEKPVPKDSEALDKNSGEATPESTPVVAVPLAPLFSQEEAFTSEAKAFTARIRKWHAGPHVTFSASTRNSFEIEVATSERFLPSDVQVIEVLPWMKVHGHGVPKALLPIIKIEKNIIFATQMGFTMAGPWEVRVKATVNGVTDILEIPVVVP